MPVGTGSINRAARSSKKAAEVIKGEEKIIKEPTVVPEGGETAPKKRAPKKTAEKKPVKKSECCHLTEELPVHLL